MKRTLAILIILAAMSSEWLSAGTNGYLLNGYNAKSFGRGGTTIARPDNLSVILTNPAGLAFLDKRSIGLGFGLLIPKVQFRNAVNDNTVADQKYYPMPFSGYADPREGSSWAWGVGLNVVGGMGAEYVLDHALLGEQKYFSNFGYMTFGPSFAYRINDQWAVGAGFQLYYGMLDFKMPFSIEPVANLQGHPVNNPGMTFGQMFAAPTNQGGFGYTEVTAYANMKGLKGYGAGANLGVIFKPNDRWTLGLAYTSPAKMILKGKAVMDMTDQFNEAFGLAVQGYMAQNPTATLEQAQAAVGQMFTNMGINLSQGVAAEYGKNTAEFGVPQKLGLGVSFKPSDKLILALDLEWINWSAAFKKMPIKLKDGSSENINLMINGETTDGTFNYNFPLKWKDAYNFKFGADYSLDDKTNIRAGFIHGKNPVPGNTLFAIFPAIVENHITLGVGRSFTDRFTVDLAYIYTLNKKQQSGSTHLIGQEYVNSRDQLREQMLMTSFTYSF